MASLDPTTGYTCVSCRLVFQSADLQRDHYRTEWHRYNLKRQLLPVTLEQFESRVLAYREEKRVSKEEQDEGPLFCSACNKQFQSTKAFENHLQSKKHLENERKKPKGPKQQPPKQRVPMEVDENFEESDDEDSDDSSSGWVTDHGTEDEDDELDESQVTHSYFLVFLQALSVTSCLFCPERSSEFERNTEHMNLVHGFVVPDAKYCCDLKGLIKYLGLKVGAGRACIFCPDRRTRFSTVDACQKHMRDKSHCKLNREAESMLELADYFDYRFVVDSIMIFSSMYEEGENETDADVLYDDGYTLTLPSGAKIGHRSLLRFYRQHLRPIGDDKRRGGEAIRKAIQANHGGALAWTGTTGALAVRTAKDIKFIQKLRSKQMIRLGVKSNKLFVSRGRSDQ